MPCWSRRVGLAGAGLATSWGLRRRFLWRHCRGARVAACFFSCLRWGRRRGCSRTSPSSRPRSKSSTSRRRRNPDSFKRSIAAPSGAGRDRRAGRFGGRRRRGRRFGQRLARAATVRDRIDDGVVRVAVGEERDRDELTAAFGEHGFEKVSMVEGPGEFAVRGGIVDVFDHLGLHPCRIELFGDEVDSIRTFDPATQRSLVNLEQVALSLLLPETAATSIGDGHLISAMLPQGALVILREPEEIEAAVKRHLEQAVIDGSREPGDDPLASLGSHSRIELTRLPSGDLFDFDIGAIQARGSDIGGAVETLDALSGSGAEIAVGFSTESERNRFWTAVKEETDDLLFRSLETRSMRGFVGTVFSGFNWRDAGQVVVNHRELFDIAIQPRRLKPKAAPQSRAIDDFVDLGRGRLRRSRRAWDRSLPGHRDHRQGRRNAGVPAARIPRRGAPLRSGREGRPRAEVHRRQGRSAAIVQTRRPELVAQEGRGLPSGGGSRGRAAGNAGGASEARGDSVSARLAPGSTNSRPRSRTGRRPIKRPPSKPCEPTWNRSGRWIG